jgi:hypothetical protein
VDDAPHLGEGELPPLTLEQPLAERVLQRADLATDGRRARCSVAAALATPPSRATSQKWRRWW